MVGGFLGAMSGWGVRYQRQVQDGKVLISAIGGPREVAAAERAISETGPAELNVHTAERSAEDAVT